MRFIQRHVIYTRDQRKGAMMRVYFAESCCSERLVLSQIAEALWDGNKVINYH